LSVTNLKTLSSEDCGYKCWLEKFKNGFNQARKEFRKILTWVEEAVDSMEVDADDDGSSIEDLVSEKEYKKQGFMTPYDQINDDLYSVLMEKTEDKVLRKLRLVDEGDGILGFAKIHHWITQATALKIQDKQAALMKPEAPKNEKDLVEHIEKWKEDLKQVEKMLGQELMSDYMKVTALKSMLLEKLEDHIELMGFKKYEKVEKEVMRLANRTRLKNDREKG